MRITSNILGSLAASVKRSLLGSYETEILIPPTVQPTVEARDVLRQTPTAVGGIEDSTFLFENADIVTNSVTITRTLFTLNPGLWEFDVDWHYSSNYSSLNAGTLIGIQFSGGQTNIVRAETVPAAGGTIHGNRHFKVATDVALPFVTSLFANAVGQSHVMWSSIYGARLL